MKCSSLGGYRVQLTTRRNQSKVALAYKEEKLVARRDGRILSAGQSLKTLHAKPRSPVSNPGLLTSHTGRS